MYRMVNWSGPVDSMNHRTLIIAEAGVNHNGDIEIAKKMIDAAAISGADAVKFQTFSADRMACRSAVMADYQKQNIGKVETQYQMLKRLELNTEGHRILKSHCESKGIIFLSSPFDLQSIDLLIELGLEIFKIPSGEITNLPYLRKIGLLQKKVILSTGMSTLKEVEDALNVLVSAGTAKDHITVLHCNTEYPTRFEDVNLRAMITMRDKLRVRIGYSDHTLGIEVPIAAVAMGAEVIEKHFTLDRKMEGPDHRASLEPRELNEMVFSIRNIEKAMGDGEKVPSCSESKNIPIARKSIVAAIDIAKGETFTERNLTVKRTGVGVNPMEWDRVITKVAKKNFKDGDLIEL